VHEDLLGRIELAAVGILLLLLVWFAMGLVISVVGGWSRLAEAYRFVGAYEGEKRGWQSASFRYYTNYNFSLTVGVGAQGLYLAGPWIFRAGHPPLLIPWTDLSVERAAREGAPVTLRAQRAPDIPIRVSHRMFERLRPRLPDTVHSAWGAGRS